MDNFIVQNREVIEISVWVNFHINYTKSPAPPALYAYTFVVFHNWDIEYSVPF